MSESTIGHYLGWAIVRRSNSPYLWVVGWHNGRRHRESAKSHLAEAARKLIKMRVKEIALRGKVVGPEIERTTYRDMEAMLVADLEANRSPRYLANARYRLVHLRRGFGPTLFREITHDRLNRYKTHRLRQGAAAATVQYELKLLRRMFTLAAKAERVDRIPPFPTVTVENARQGFASPTEIERVASHAAEHVATVIRLLGLTGMRTHEALSLRWSRVDFEAQAIRLRAEDTKTHRARTIPFGNLRTLAELLTHQRERVRGMEREAGRITPEVFPDVSAATFKRHWYRAVKAAGLPALRPHDLRRSAARNLIRAGVSQHVAMAILGHRTDAMFRRYNITSAQDLSDGMGRLNEFLEAATATQNATLAK